MSERPLARPAREIFFKLKKLKGTFRPMPAFVRKSLETDEKRKALEAQTPENWKNKLCPNPSTTSPASIRACPALRAPGSTRAQNPRAAPHPKAG